MPKSSRIALEGAAKEPATINGVRSISPSSHIYCRSWLLGLAWSAPPASHSLYMSVLAIYDPQAAPHLIISANSSSDTGPGGQSEDPWILVPTGEDGEVP